jgi:putative endonuclease
MNKRGYVYLLTNFDKTVLYAGVTSDLVKRVYEHKNKLVDGFTKKYSVDQLVYYEVFDDIEYAIAREKQIKGGSRKKKEEIINSMNPDWRDLYKDILN